MFAVFLGGATMAGLFGNIYKTFSKVLIPSVGASGGILALIALTCVSHPDARLSIAFVDQLIPHSFSGRTALYAVVAFDILGIVMGWRLFDHAGHLGGVVFGWWYAVYGVHLWRKYQKPVVRWWRDYKQPPEKKD